MSKNRRRALDNLVYYDEYATISPYMWRYLRVLHKYNKAVHAKVYTTPGYVDEIKLTIREHIVLMLFILSHRTRFVPFRIIGTYILKL